MMYQSCSRSHSGMSIFLSLFDSTRALSAAVKICGLAFFLVVVMVVVTVLVVVGGWSGVGTESGGGHYQSGG